MRTNIARAASLSLPLVLAACGGGSGGPGLSLTLSPGLASASITAGQSYAFTETGTVSGTLSGTVVAQAVDSDGAINPQVQLEPQGAGSYLAHFTTVNTLGAGEHRGSITVNLCGDSACRTVYASAVLPYDFAVSNPAPALSGVSARSATAGCKGFTLTVAGSGFVPGVTQLLWNGQPRATAGSSATSLQASITDADLANAGSATLSLANPAPGGGTTATLAFAVNAAGSATDATAEQIDAAHSGAVKMLCPPSLPVSSLWDVDLGGVAGTPVILQDGVFATGQTPSGGTLYALDPVTGSTRWSKSALNDSADAMSGLTYDAGRLFVAGSNKYVQAFNPADGSLLWKIDSTTTQGEKPLAHTPPVAANGQLYVFSAAYNGFLQAYDEGSGALLWQQVFGFGYEGIIPGADAGAVYVARPCTTTKFSPVNGAVIWSHFEHADISCGATGNGMPVIAGGQVYAPDLAYSNNGHIHDVTYGAITGDLLADQPPAVDGQRSYIVEGNTLTATDLATGQVLWTFSNPQLDVAPIVVNEIVFVGCSAFVATGCGTGQLFALDAVTGAVLWSLAVPGTSFGPGVGASQEPTLAAAHGLLIVPCDTVLRAYRIAEK